MVLPKSNLPRKVTPRHPVVCVGLKSLSGKLALLAKVPAGPVCRASHGCRLHLKTFTQGAAHTACCFLNYSKSLVIGDEIYELAAGECAVVVETSLDELMTSGWNDFNMDSCVWVDRSECRVDSTTICLLRSSPACDIQYLERMLATGNYNLLQVVLLHEPLFLMSYTLKTRTFLEELLACASSEGWRLALAQD